MRSWFHLSVSLLLLCACGCGGKAPETAALPARHSIQSDQLLVLSDRKLEKDHPLIQDLVALRKEVAGTLELPLEGRPVVVYVFKNQEPYVRYMKHRFPRLPPRRAYFVGTPEELGVYTFWGERIREDLRHEFTHGLLHANLQSVPLWLDEGLAEYFEVVGPSVGSVNTAYTQHLARAIPNGWRPDLKRLESLTEVSQMQRNDYQEAWAWVHFMLHSSFETRGVLLAYLRDLRRTQDPGPLSERLFAAQPASQSRFLSYLATLQTGRFVVRE